jgi:hypothetical protein
LRAVLVRETHTLQQLLESKILTQTIKHRIHFKIGKPYESFFKSAIQPIERANMIFESQVNQRDTVRRLIGVCLLR